MLVVRYVTKSCFFASGRTNILVQSYYDRTHFLDQSNLLSKYNLRLDTFARPISRIRNNLCLISVRVNFCIKYNLRSDKIFRPFSIIGHNMCPTSVRSNFCINYNFRLDTFPVQLSLIGQDSCPTSVLFHYDWTYVVSIFIFKYMMVLLSVSCSIMQFIKLN